MGASGSSSKRRSSKKRNQKTSSQKKKNKGKESKKRHRRHDSVSSFSHDDSVNSDCSSSSKSISDYRRKMKKSNKRRRPRDCSISSYSDDHSRSTGSDSLSTRDNIRKSKKLKRTKTASKSSNKVARKRYSSPESYGDVHRVRKTKRKRSTEDRVSKRKKKSSTKKSKRHLSPHSLSCSTCPSKSSNSSSTVDAKSERSKQIVNTETEIVRDKNCEVMSLKRSSYLPPVNNSRRLRSVINVAYQPDEQEEDDRWNSNPREEEIVHESENYPSPISLDSNEVGGKREVDSHSHGISNKRIKLEHVTTEEKTELGKVGIHFSHTNDFEEKETDACVPVAALDGDLESILRQKALENLRKFKAGLQTAPQSITNVKTNNENDVPNKSTKQATPPQTQLMNQRSGLTFEKDSSRLEVKKHPEPEDERIEEEPGTVKQNIITVSTSDVNPGTPVTDSSIMEPTSSVRPISGKHALEEERDEVKDGPEFEQKTMSVMRGGEMVQVTYKVKIPKRAPALARRQLRR